MGLPQGHRSGQKTCSVWAALHKPQFLAEASSSMGTPWPATSFKACPPTLAWDPPWTVVWTSALATSSVGCRRATCFTMGIMMSCTEISAPPTASLTVVSAGLFLSRFLTPRLELLHCFLNLFLNVLLQRCRQCCWWTGALACTESVVEPAATTVSLSHGGRSWCLLTEEPLQPPATKTLPDKPVNQ